MNRRKIAIDYRGLAIERGFEWLGPEVPNVMSKTLWKCSEGHKWEARYNNIQRGTGCPYCAGNMPKIAGDYRDLAKEHGFKWLGPQVQNARTKTNWECAHGHQWGACYDSIRRPQGCPICSARKNGERKRLKPAAYQVLAETYDFEWLGPEVFNNRTKTWWQCPFGHKWEAPYDRIQQGHGCAVCTNHVPKKAKDYDALADKRGFERTGQEVPSDTSFKTKWKCSQGHEWEARYHDVSQGTGCPYCAGLIRKVAKDYHLLAKNRGFKWVGSSAPDTHTKTLWECDRGHQWEASYNKIGQGRGCPHCIDMINGARVSKIQKELCRMIGGELNYPCGSYNIDIALPEDEIAIEYDSWYWHSDRLENDKQRDRVLLNAGWRILHVKSNNQLPIRKQIDNALFRLRNGVEITEIILDDWGKGATFVNLRTNERTSS